MKKLLVLIAASATLVSCTRIKTDSKPAKSYPPSQIVANQFVFGGERAPVDAYLKEKGIKASVETLSAEDRHYWVKYEGDVSVGQIVADLTDKTEFVEPNQMVHATAAMRKTEWPSDKLFFKQWAMNNIGQAPPFGLPGKRDADLDVLRVWDKVTKGSEDVVVAVIDTGCDYTHPDLKDNI